MKTLAFITTLAFINPCFASPFTTITTSAELKSYLVKKKFNGVVYVADKEKVLLKEAFGYRNLNTQEKLETDDLFQIGSTTKQMVALGILKLQDAGKLSINHKLKDYVSVPESYSEITIKDILNHSSGITNFTDRQEFWDKLEADTVLTHQDIINFINQYPLDFETRTKWQYSNSGYIFAGKIIEDLSGQSWDKFLSQNIFQPLQMNHTGYALHFEKVSPVKGNVKIKGDVFQQVDDFNMSWALAAGALYSNAEDMSKWLKNYSDNSLITSESMDAMLTPFKRNYGLGVIIQNKDNDQFITHEGRTPGYVTQIGQLKNRGLSIVAFDNKDGAGGDVRSLLYNLFVRGKAEAIKPETIAVSAKDLQEYNGTYSDGTLTIKVYERDGSLFMFPEGQREIGTRAVDKDEFDLEGFAAEEFIRDENGKITSMKHYQGDYTAIFSRLQ